MSGFTKHGKVQKRRKKLSFLIYLEITLKILINDSNDIVIAYSFINICLQLLFYRKNC